MPDPEQSQQEQPLKSYTELGLPPSFSTVVKSRQALGAEIKALTEKQKADTVTIKRAFVEQFIGEDVDPDEDEDTFKEYLTAVAETGQARCSVAGFRVAIIPGKRSSLDQKALALSMINAGLKAGDVAQIIKDATVETTWGEIEIEAIKADKEPDVKPAPKVRKPAASKVKAAVPPAKKPVRKLPPSSVGNRGAAKKVTRRKK